MAWSKTFVGIGATFLFGIAAVLLGYAQPLFSLVADWQAPIVDSPPYALDFDQGILYIGTRSASDVEHFQGIFYAEDPSGEKRLLPPVPTKHARGTVINATQPGAWCPRTEGDVLLGTNRGVNVSEDCLSLRIARPARAKADSMLPVLVKMHGDGQIRASAQDELIESDSLIAKAESDGQPLVLVAVNHRISTFGTAEGEAPASAHAQNLGSRDQRAALDWIRDNIVYFGGDPERVTEVSKKGSDGEAKLQMKMHQSNMNEPLQKVISS